MFLSVIELVIDLKPDPLLTTTHELEAASWLNQAAAPPERPKAHTTWGSGFRVIGIGLGFRVSGLGFRVRTGTGEGIPF